MCGYDSRLIAQRVRAARRALRLTQREVGAALGMTDAQYGHYERGRSRFYVEHILQLADVLGRPADWLLGYDSQLTDDELEALALYRRSVSLGEGVNALRVLRALVTE